MRCDGCDAIAQSEIHFARFNVRTPRGIAQGNADQPMVPPGWTEATIRPDPHAIVPAGRPVLDPFTTPAQKLADLGIAPQPVFRCPTCSAKADDKRAVEEAAGLDIRPAPKREIILDG